MKMAPGPNDIRYVCLSDMHLGAEGSLLTNMPAGSVTADPLHASLVLQELVYCLRDLVLRDPKAPKPTLILLGDILELALANDNVAAMVFWRFLDFAMEKGRELFSNIIYIPGNHDHHLWESARETQYALNYLTNKRPGEFLDIPWHTTKIFMGLEEKPNQVPSFFLNVLLHRYDHLKDFTINTAYPNLGLIKDNRCIVFHHGHFVESIYQLMTTLKNLIFPEQKALIRTVDDLEAENFAWIDFFWSTLGRSGEFGKDVEIIYDKMQDPEQFQKLLNTLAGSLEEKYGIKGLVGGKIIEVLVDKLVNQERTKTDQLLSPDAETGLWYYVNQPLFTQIRDECLKRNSPFPSQTTFVFGHTHKPFEDLRKFEAYLGDGVPVYNTGGWVVETVDPAEFHGGAVLLLNENLDVVSLRMYNEASGPVNVEVHEQPPPGQGHSDFFNHINGLVQPDQPPWSKFSQTVVGEVSIREENLKAKVTS
jgi:hypothetical protein